MTVTEIFIQIRVSMLRKSVKIDCSWFFSFCELDNKNRYRSYCVRVLLFRDGKNAEIVSFLDIHDRKPVYTAPVYSVHEKTVISLMITKSFMNPEFGINFFIDPYPSVA